LNDKETALLPKLEEEIRAGNTMKKALLFTSIQSNRFASTFTAVAVLALALGACSKKKAEAEKTPALSASAVDPNADGKRLERAINDWKRRWEHIELESCDDVLKEASDQELCKKTQAALTKVKDIAAKLDKGPDAIRAAGELIETSEAAIEKLRDSTMTAMAAGSSSASPATKPAGSVTVPKPVGSASKPKTVKPSSSAGALAGADAGAIRHEDPRTKTLSSYERAARSAARYLGSFLQQGPLDVRKQAFAEVQRLVPLRERWLTLRDVVRQASLTERDVDLRKQLRDVEQKLRSSTPPPTPGMPSGPMPGGPMGPLGRPLPGRPMPGGPGGPAPGGPGAQRPPAPAAPAAPPPQ
ncbi:MAG TPA: hypothetical protein VGP93_19135, partial [Polyangiaceae bacterium]|nr:hypothetical protein [Polyangiaceae bacterium]